MDAASGSGRSGAQTPLRIAMWGIAHGHARGKVRTLAAHPGVEFCGVYEPDSSLRAQIGGDPAFAGLRWFDSADEFLTDQSIAAVCVEGPEGGRSDWALRCAEAGKHLWYDKPGGEWTTFRSLIATARDKGLGVQMGYMLRYNATFRQIADWAHDGLLGELFAIRGHMSSSSSEASRGGQGQRGGVAFQLAPHLIDQAVWLFAARPDPVRAFLRNDATPRVPEHVDNSLTVLEFDRGMAYIDIAHMEPAPPARRFEVYGTRGSAIAVEPFEPGGTIRLCLTEASGGFERGAQKVRVESTPRDDAYRHELDAFVATLRGRRPPDRSLDHELLVEETLHRAVGTLT